MPITIFTDGACSGNPGPGGWAAIVLCADRVRELGGAAAQTTNNRMELTATIEALRSIEPVAEPVELYTDSTYVIGGVTQWVHGWKKNGWRKKGGDDVLNRDLWEILDRLNGARRASGPVSWHYVRGHAGHDGNERCDEIAVAYSRGTTPALFDGPVASYTFNLVPPADPGAPAKTTERATPKPKAKGPAVYLSLIGGVLERHDDWTACNARVKGVPNARYRKASSPEEEAAILRDWGVS